MEASRRGRALVLLGLFALGRAACRAPEQVSALEAGTPVSLRLEDLRGDDFRLLPGVGPVLASRLEEARQSAGGVLDEYGAERVRGVGPTLLARWRSLQGR